MAGGSAVAADSDAASPGRCGACGAVLPTDAPRLSARDPGPAPKQQIFLYKPKIRNIGIDIKNAKDKALNPVS